VLWPCCLVLMVRSWALFGHGAMSDFNPLSAPKRTSALPYGLRPHAPKIQFPKPNQADLGRPVAAQKIFRFTFNPNHRRMSGCPVPARGAVARRHERGTGCGGRESVGASWRSQGELKLVSDRGRARRTAFERTAKPCGPDTRCWCQVGGGELRPDRVEQHLQSADDGDKTNSSPRRAWHKPSNHCAGNAGCLR
jgi:hypothetical protein